MRSGFIFPTPIKKINGWIPDRLLNLSPSATGSRARPCPVSGGISRASFTSNWSQTTAPLTPSFIQPNLKECTLLWPKNIQLWSTERGCFCSRTTPLHTPPEERRKKFENSNLSNYCQSSIQSGPGAI